VVFTEMFLNPEQGKAIGASKRGHFKKIPIPLLEKGFIYDCCANKS